MQRTLNLPVTVYSVINNYTHKENHVLSRRKAILWKKNSSAYDPWLVFSFTEWTVFGPSPLQNVLVVVLSEPKSNKTKPLKNESNGL